MSNRYVFCCATMPRHKPAAEFDRPAGLVSEKILDQERHAAKRTVAERSFVESVNTIGVGFDDGMDGGVDRLNRCRGGRRQLAR